MGTEPLLNTKDLETMFGMFDVTRRRTITMKQVRAAPGPRFRDLGLPYVSTISPASARRPGRRCGSSSAGRHEVVALIRMRTSMRRGIRVSHMMLTL